MSHNKLKKYYITIEEQVVSFGITYKIDLEDHYGNYNQVYERTVEEALNYARNWCKQAEERKVSKDIHAKAVKEMIKLDKQAGITSNTSDGLD